MKLSPIALLAIALCAGFTQASGQDRKTSFNAPPPPVVQHPGDVPPDPDSKAAVPKDTLLGVNYRIAITAKENGRQVGGLEALTCTSPFQMSGSLEKRNADDPAGPGLSVRGALAEVEGGTLKLGYDVTIHSLVPVQSIGMLGGGPSARTSTHTSKRTGTSGMLLLKPGQSYDVMQISGVVYSITITPTETPPAPANARKQAGEEPGNKPEPGAKPPAGAAAAPQPSAESFRRETAARNGPSEEDRKRYESLSDEAKEKFRDSMREVFTHPEFRNAPEEERRAQIRKLFDKAAAEDQAGKK